MDSFREFFDEEYKKNLDVARRRGDDHRRRQEERDKNSEEQNRKIMNGDAIREIGEGLKKFREENNRDYFDKFKK